MKFYRITFWTLAVLQWAAGLWFCLGTDKSSPGTPELLFQLQGLIYFALGCGIAWVAENPGDGVPVISLATLMKALMLAFTLVALTGNEIGSGYFQVIAALELSSLPLCISYFFWYYHKPRPNRFVPLIGLFGEKD